MEYNARRKRIYMRVGLLKPKFLSVDAMSSRLKILNHYLTTFPLSDNKSLFKREMNEIILSLLFTVWINSMIKASLEPREKVYEGLIEYLENLESSLPDQPITKKVESKDAPESTSILKKVN